jgi:hypothetical protein
VGFGYKLSISFRTEENHGIRWWGWPVEGPSRCKLTSRQQSGMKYANPNVSSYLAVALFGNVCRFVSQRFLLRIRVWPGWSWPKHLPSYPIEIVGASTSPRPVTFTIWEAYSLHRF